MGDVIDFKPTREFEVGDRVAYEQPWMGGDGYSHGVVSAKHGHNYEIVWDDGYVDDPDVYYGWDELLRPDEVEE